MRLTTKKNKDDTTERQQYQKSSSQARNPAPIVLTSLVNLIELQRQLKGLLKGKFEFCDTKNGARVLKKKVADFLTNRSQS